MFSVFTLKYRMSLRGTSSQFSRKLKGTPGELEDVLEMSFLIVEHQSGFNRTGIRVRVPWTARRSNQSTLNEINPEYSLEGLMLKLKFQYFGRLMGRANSLEKILILGKIQDRRRRE